MQPDNIQIASNDVKSTTGADKSLGKYFIFLTSEFFLFCIKN